MATTARDGEQLLEMMRGYQVSCVMAAAVDLDLFSQLGETPLSANDVAQRCEGSERGITILLDALAAIGLVAKVDAGYSLPSDLAPYLRADSTQSAIPMLRHQSVCLRRWARLPWMIRAGEPEDQEPTLRGAEADQEAFIQAMHVVSRDVAPQLIPEISPGGVKRILDLGGASGSWTLAWLNTEPLARAVLFDLPHVIPMARARLSESRVANRVEYVAGDFYTDALPRGNDLVWVSAIIHQNSRAQNRDMFQRIADALEPAGWIYIRDVVLDRSRTKPVSGALFAINMFAATEGGNSYSLAEIEADLQATGFSAVEHVRQDEGMHNIVRARIQRGRTSNQPGANAPACKPAPVGR